MTVRSTTGTPGAQSLNRFNKLHSIFSGNDKVKFEKEIRAICQRLSVCKSEDEAIALCKELQDLTHVGIEQAREKARLLPLIHKQAEADASKP